MRRLVIALIVLVAVACSTHAADAPKRILILTEGSSSLKNEAIGIGRQLGALLGHFNVVCTIEGVNEYTPKQMDSYDFTFYAGLRNENPVPAKFADEVLTTNRRLIWLGSGIKELCQRPGAAERLGFTANKLDTTSGFNQVRYAGKTFTKKDPATTIIEVRPKSKVDVLATVYSPATRKEHPYLVQTGTVSFFADSPFSYADEATEYLLFSDMLHDILGEPHEEVHSALIRIEDVTPMESPDRLRDIADILAGRNIPFLVGVVPFYVNPSEGVRISLSDKPELVDALKYMVQNGGTIVMHGVTHQYRGVTAADYEFWDENTESVIKGQTVEDISKKLDLGIQEFMKNGLYPVVWETPHYTASFQLYQTVAQYFSTAMEQRLSIENVDYSQFFPYIIKKDLFGQRIYPEDLGYIPLDPDREKSERSVQAIVSGAKDLLAVRDGYASCFFHAFVNHDLLKEIVDGIQSLGYTYVDMREQTNWVKTKDRVILTGTQEYAISLSDQYLVEAYYEHNGELIKRTVSDQRVNGQVSRSIELEPGQFYRAEPTEFRERQTTFIEQVGRTLENVYSKFNAPDNTWRAARPILLWNHRARGAAFNDQAGFASAFASVNIPVDTLFVGDTVSAEHVSLSQYNLVIVPDAFVDSLDPPEYGVLKRFVQDGGCLITDGKNDLAEELGVKFIDNKIRVARIRDRLFPEERIVWRYPQLVSKFETSDNDEVFCADENTQAPMAAGRTLGKGKFIFFSSLFDPQSGIGTSQYPYLLEYVRRYFKLGPVVRRNNLEVFFDPGLRRNISVENLVKQWVSGGVRVIHVAGWHEYAKYVYDYSRLITLAHANGMLVYAWIEPPQVSEKFWKDHPEWREKNYKNLDVGGEPVHASWRYPVALTEKACLETVVRKFRAFFEQFEFDGVNLGELYFDSGRGFDDPEIFTPMHPSARDAFKKRYGFELTSIFDHNSPTYWKTNPAAKTDVVEFRIAKLHEAYSAFLDMFAEITKERPGFEVIVTAMDSYGSPELREWIGVDMTSILGLQHQYGFSLSVEDPEHLWSTTPLRYSGIGKRYAQLVSDSTKLLLDLNIGSFRKPEVITEFPTTIQTGTESFQMVRSSADGAPRTVIYSEATANPQDLIFFPFASAEGATVERTSDGYDIVAPWSFMLRLPREIVEIRIDGIPIAPSRMNDYLVPAGKHAIAFSTDHANLSAHELQPRIMACTGTLKTVSYDQRTIRFEYLSDSRTLVSFNRAPESITVDGNAYSTTVMKGNDCFSIFLPSGSHQVQLIAGDQFSYGVSWTSFWSSTVIAIFGFVAVTMLLLMYMVVVVIRRRTRIVEVSR
jgi:uncharacterized protein YdaL